jgi:GTP-binding protein
VLFTSGFLQAGYRRFVERRLREEFGFEGSPVQVTMRLREKRSGRSRAGGRAGSTAGRGPRG